MVNDVRIFCSDCRGASQQTQRPWFTVKNAGIAGPQVEDALVYEYAPSMKLLGVGRSTVYDLMRLQVLPSVKVGRARRIPASCLRECVDRLTTAIEVS